MFEVKSTHVHTTYIYKVQIFVRFSLRWSLFELQPQGEKSAVNNPKMTLTCSKSQVPICMPHTPMPHTPMTRFELWPNFQKGACTAWPWVTLTCSRSKVSICIPYMPTMPKLCPFYSMMSPCLSYGPYWEKITKRLQNYLDIFKVKKCPYA